MEEKYNRRQFLKTLEGIVIGSIPLIYNCSKNPVELEPELKEPELKIGMLYVVTNCWIPEGCGPKY